MGCLRGFAVSFLLVVSSASCLADPIIHVDEPPGLGLPVGLSFTFSSDGSGGGFLTFTNTSGVDWTFLEIDVPAPSPIAPILCASNVFTCGRQWFTEDGAFATIDFSGGTGIANGATFTIDLGSSGWTPNATFLAFANETDESSEPVPEPGTLVLLLAGLARAAVTATRRFSDGRAAR